MEEPRVLRGYALAVLALVLATLVRWLLDSHISIGATFPTYFAAVTLVALYGGAGPAAVTIVGGALLASVLFMRPNGVMFTPGAVDWLGAVDWVGVALFAASSGVIVALAQWLRTSSSTLAAIVSTAHESIVTRDLQGIVTGWNAGAERMYGYTRDDMIGAPFSQLLPPAKTDEVSWLSTEVQAGRPVDALESERVRKDGHRIDVVISAAPIRDGRGRVIGIATIERDVTERKRVERAQRASEARLRAIIDNSPVVLFIKDLEGRYFLVNRAYAALFNTTVEKLMGVTDFDRFPREVAESYRQNDVAVAQTGEAHTFEETIELNGETRTYLSTKFPLRDDHGEVYAVCGISTDITEEIRRREQLIDLDARKDQFLSMLAHELRNPLAPIANAVQLIRLQPDLNPRISWAGEVIARQTRHLTRMVDDLLDIARFNTGRVQLRRDAVDLTSLARQAVEDLRSRFEARGVALDLHLPDEPVMVDADAARVVQVIDNLLDNAAKYTDAGGRASLIVERLGAEGVLRVRDTGIGIDHAHLPHVFDLFEQVDSSLARSSGGLGLGLNLVKRMVDLHGGSVSASSAGPGQGAEFVVRLPAAARRAGNRPNVLVDGSMAGLGGGSRRVLVIEDNPDTARSMEMLLQALGHAVRVAQTGNEGVAMAKDEQPELVLIDLGLPDIDGYQVARELRRRFGAELRLVALTGYGQQEHRMRSREAGFDEHLLKPLSLEALNRVLEASTA